jgi:hypothetical protein
MIALWVDEAPFTPKCFMEITQASLTADAEASGDLNAATEMPHGGEMERRQKATG